MINLFANSYWTLSPASEDKIESLTKELASLEERAEKILDEHTANQSREVELDTMLKDVRALFEKAQEEAQALKLHEVDALEEMKKRENGQREWQESIVTAEFALSKQRQEYQELPVLEEEEEGEEC